MLRSSACKSRHSPAIWHRGWASHYRGLAGSRCPAGQSGCSSAIQRGIGSPRSLARELRRWIAWPNNWRREGGRHGEHGGDRYQASPQRLCNSANVSLEIRGKEKDNQWQTKVADKSSCRGDFAAVCAGRATRACAEGGIAGGAEEAGAEAQLIDAARLSTRLL